MRASIAAALPGLRASDAKVMRVVMADSAFVQSATTDEVAGRAGVSPATVVRAARAAGFHGFGDLKLALARASGQQPVPNPPDELTSQSTLDELCDTVLASHAASIRSVRATLRSAALRRAVTLLNSAREILVFGVGTSASPAADAAYRWTTIGCRAQAPRDVRTAQLQARLLTAEDVVVAVSHTGRSAETLAVVEAARTPTAARIVVITSFDSSPLAERADALLVAGGPDLGLQMGSSSSRLAHLAVIDVLHAGIALADLPRTRRALQASAEITKVHSA